MLICLTLETVIPTSITTSTMAKYAFNNSGPMLHHKKLLTNVNRWMLICQCPVCDCPQALDTMELEDGLVVFQHHFFYILKSLFEVTCFS